MEYKITIPPYENGFKLEWEENHKISLKIDDGQVLLIANKAALISLAKHLINLSQDDFKSGYHFHLDKYNSLEEDSDELIIQKR